MIPPIPSDASPCPCQSGAIFAACCAPFLRGQAVPPTAESLMRSRYSAYVCRASEYLLATWHPTHRPRKLDLRSDSTEWLGLRIVDVVDGGSDDQSGIVEFIARFRQGGHVASLHERSRFVRTDGTWLYVDGEVKRQQPQASPSASPPASPVTRVAGPGRNDPCPCGSGQKYKRCCGR